ncbi:MAG TPA: VOC family protein [Candidatus Eisenbacteria bacterium]|nr:VOC family protein [Candidatus Eisenbacteria bacterium]
MTTTLKARSLVPTITANDLDRSIRFYEGLGFTITEKMEEEGKVLGVMMDAGGSTLGLSQDDFAKGKDRVKGVGMRLYLETDQDIETLANQAIQAGLRLDQGPAPLPWGPMGFTVTDPDGFRLTISKPT